MKTKFYSLYGKAVDAEGKNHIVTVVGKLEQKRKQTMFTDNVSVPVKPGSVVDGVLMYTKKAFNRKLTIGMSICHPLDEFNEETGIEVAKSRIKRGDNLGHIETSSVTMLTEDAIMAELFVKLQHIIDNIDKYLP